MGSGRKVTLSSACNLLHSPIDLFAYLLMGSISVGGSNFKFWYYETTAQFSNEEKGDFFWKCCKHLKKKQTAYSFLQHNAELFSYSDRYVRRSKAPQAVLFQKNIDWIGRKTQHYGEDLTCKESCGSKHHSYRGLYYTPNSTILFQPKLMMNHSLALWHNCYPA